MNGNLIYFSPTYTTKKIVKLVGEHIFTNTIEFDITILSEKNKGLAFSENDFVILGIPVYSGRVPKLAKGIISMMHGNHTPIALIATYGNRHFDDSLLELKTIVQSNGFLCIAAAAFVTEHSVVRKFGAGRPNHEDIAEVHNFSELLKNTINSWDKAAHIDLSIPGNQIYRAYKSIPMKPHATSKCTKCGLCAKNCPAVAIPFDNPRRTDKRKCVTCVRCIRICPQKARRFYAIETFIAEKSLAKLCQEYKKAKVFI